MLENDVYKWLKTVCILHLQVRPGKESRKWCLHKMQENENVKQSQQIMPAIENNQEKIPESLNTEFCQKMLKQIISECSIGKKRWQRTQMAVINRGLNCVIHSIRVMMPQHKAGIPGPQHSLQPNRQLDKKKVINPTADKTINSVLIINRLSKWDKDMTTEKTTGWSKKNTY